MERNHIHINGRISPSTIGDRGSTVRSVASSLQHNYRSRAVRVALEHLASVDLLELCSEAKVERCRATRDLRSCGREVENVLISCGHASLCSECSQRCDICPICRIPIPNNNRSRVKLRLYYECIEAGLISKKFDERLQEKEDERLYSLFDVAMENNLVSVICHYVTDVCMDESAVSSDPVISFLLDEVVVKDWCKRTFSNILLELKGIYNLDSEEMKTRLNVLVKLATHLTGVSDVLEVLESSFKGNLSAQLHDLQFLQDSISKAKQHIEIIKWCIRHKFLENVKSHHSNFASWQSVVRERKSAAIKRPWPDVVNQSADSSMQSGSLFIEDALANLDVEQGIVPEIGEELELSSLQKDRRSFFRAKIEGVVGYYPFESLRAAVDVLFLHGSSDMVVAKQAILLYYLFDWHWTMPNETWRHIVDDFAATFGISRHALLESLVFYLLDDHSDEALKEACHLLPEISGPSTHPKIAQVLLEREVPEMALMVLQCSGRDGSQISLSEAVTAVRARVECGLLTEAFVHQRMHCTKVREKKWKDRLPEGAYSEIKGDHRTWEDWMEILVTEICCLCIKSKLVDRMIELPWNSDEEKYIHKCLLECAIDDPSTTMGSLLVVFYLQRYRYSEACQVDLKLQSMEQDFLSKNPVSEELLSKMKSARTWRTGLVAKSIELLPQVQQQQAKTRKLLPNIYDIPSEEVATPAKADISTVQQPKSSSLLIPPFADASLVQQIDHVTPFKSLVVETSVRGASTNRPCIEPGNYASSSVLQEKLFTNAGIGLKPQDSIHKNVKYDGTPTPGIPWVSPIFATPLKCIGKTSSRVCPDNQLHHGKYDKESLEMEQNGLSEQFLDASPNSVANTIAISGGSHSFHQNSAWLSSKRIHSSISDDGAWNMTSEHDPMDITLSGREKGFTVDEGNANANVGVRWRSDESSDEEGGHNLESAIGVASRKTPKRGVGRSRLARR